MDPRSKSINITSKRINRFYDVIKQDIANFILILNLIYELVEHNALLTRYR